MECKFIIYNCNFYHIIELIDTLWNVNIRATRILLHPLSRINRYIMECKSVWRKLRRSKVEELIDTLWNVNLHDSDEIEVVSRINRYIMECKFY